MPLRFVLPLIALSATLSLPTSARAQTLEDAERELQAAKAEQARREAVVRAERERQRVAEQKREREAAAASRLSSLVVRSDASCNLNINAEDSGAIGPGETRKLGVPAGDVLLECTSTEDPSVKYSEIKSFEAQQNLVVLIELQARLTAAIAVKSDPRHPNRFVLSGDRLQDTRTGIYWSQSDNGSDIDWNGATQYCSGKGWTLPSVEELESLYDSGKGTSCSRFTCKVSHLFRLSSFWFWSQTANGSSEAWRVGLDDGARNSLAVSSPSLNRALCISRS